MKKLTAVWFLAALAGPAYAQQRGPSHIMLPSLPAGARVMGFTFDITGGGVSALARAPAGWQISIDNDPSWQSSITGQAIVGAAALAPADVQAMFSVAEAPQAIAADLGLKFSLHGDLTIMQNGNLQTVPLSSIRLESGDAD